jgi:hypothetical protein
VDLKKEDCLILSARIVLHDCPRIVIAKFPVIPSWERYDVQQNEPHPGRAGCDLWLRAQGHCDKNRFNYRGVDLTAGGMLR